MLTPNLGDEIMFESRLREYDLLFTTLALIPFNTRRLFDAGCANGKWLDICCRRWGALENNCFGNDKRTNVWIDWHRTNPNTQITFIPKPTVELEPMVSAFDIVHQSMMLSSIVDPEVRARTAQVLWGLLRPGGFLVSYDFWLNPFNPRTTGIGLSELKRLFPSARRIYTRRVTLAPPLCRKLTILGERVVLNLEAARVMNTHFLTALRRPE
jgi:hypothetical protein